MNKSLRTAYRVIRIDYEVDTDSPYFDESSVADDVAGMVAFRANSHNHTIENGIQITNVEDCGESC